MRDGVTNQYDKLAISSLQGNLDECLVGILHECFVSRQLEAENATLKGQVAELREDVGDLQQQVEELRNKVCHSKFLIARYQVLFWTVRK